MNVSQDLTFLNSIAVDMENMTNHSLIPPEDLTSSTFKDVVTINANFNLSDNISLEVSKVLL